MDDMEKGRKKGHKKGHKEERGRDKKRGKGRRGGGGFGWLIGVLILICLILILAAMFLNVGGYGGYGGQWGLPVYSVSLPGAGTGDGDATPAPNPNATPAPTPADGPGETSAPMVYVIRVKSDGIYHGDVKVTLAELAERLDAAEPSQVWMLRDEHAVKADFEAVQALLLEKNKTFTESSAP
jgi:hypothetical protein